MTVRRRVAGEDAHCLAITVETPSARAAGCDPDAEVGPEPIEGVASIMAMERQLHVPSIIAGDVEVILTSTVGRIRQNACSTSAKSPNVKSTVPRRRRKMMLLNAGDRSHSRPAPRYVRQSDDEKHGGSQSFCRRRRSGLGRPRGWSQDGSCGYVSRTSRGSYDISIVALAIDEDTMTPLDVPSVEVTSFSAIVSSQETFPSSCVARMALINAGGEETLADVDADITLPSTIMAGDQIAMHVLARDLHGNTTNWLGGERIAVHARGPTEIPFIPSESVGSFTATITAAGAYSVAALVGDCACNGWPRILQVVAGPCNPDKCTVSGDALGTCTTATPISLLMQATDEYGNPRRRRVIFIEAVLMNKDEGTINIRVVDNRTARTRSISNSTCPSNTNCGSPPTAFVKSAVGTVCSRASAPAGADCVISGSAAKDSCSPISRRCSFNRPTRVA